jgi:D-beta-D-heptose 7-phosphate kinase/D-beta-D-heptose 1-phosphate adenosyltransferase
MRNGKWKMANATGLAPVDLANNAAHARLWLVMVEKLLSQDKLLRVREGLRAEGKSVVFTNGVFDLLHVGHVRYLAAARGLGDALVVAINSDRTVRELKGDGRPIAKEDERAEILAALRQVDYVTIFDDVSPRSLIARLLPDVLVKGGDYGLDEIHGREEVEAAGGRVVSLPFVEGASTSTIIERMKKSRRTTDDQRRATDDER